MSENPQRRSAWGTVNKIPVKPVSFKQLMQQEEEKRVDTELNRSFPLV